MRRLIELLQQVGELLAVAQRQTDGQVQAPTALQRADGREPFGDGRHMAFENLLRRPGRRRKPEPARRQQSRGGGEAA